jgi:hypothetical protein
VSYPLLKITHKCAKVVWIFIVSLMTADLSQAIGGIMNVRWVAARHVSVGRFCTIQAAIKQFSNVGAALWSFVIAIHTFRLLVSFPGKGHVRKYSYAHVDVHSQLFNSHTSDRLCYTTLVVVWSSIITIVVVGPTVIESKSKGDYFGIAGKCSLKWHITNVLNA